MTRTQEHFRATSKHDKHEFLSVLAIYIQTTLTDRRSQDSNGVHRSTSKGVINVTFKG